MPSLLGSVFSGFLQLLSVQELSAGHMTNRLASIDNGHALHIQMAGASVGMPYAWLVGDLLWLAARGFCRGQSSGIRDKIHAE